ncbi:MAG: shikimate kinase [candidate division Zixibacteria bacterium]|nr:shikimate kinase [candidate division Zixibacteria bacterium]
MPHIGNVFLIGFSGSGKSTIGPLLAGVLKVKFLDTDSLIEKRNGKTITEIFRDNGESEFRRLEREIIATVAKDDDNTKVIALGGGAFQSSENRKIIRSCGIVIYLSCSVREIYRRLRNMDNRPLLSSFRRRNRFTGREAMMRRISNLLDKRKKTYNLADIRLSTTFRTTQEIVDCLNERILRCYA